jgi:segregation and condensation protein B
MSEQPTDAEAEFVETDHQVDDIELAYREAMAALDEAEAEVGNALTDLAEDSGTEEPQEHSVVSIGEQLARDLQDDQVEVTFTEVSEERISPREVIEAALFVGGDVALTARRLASLIGSDVESRVAVKMIDQLNQQYASENRPYEIQLQEGGFRLQLRENYVRLQSQVYGLGPKEIQLAPDVLEMLAFVAWNQPVDAEALQDTGHTKPMTPIRQLIRLQLVEVDRVGSRRKDIVYRTSDRFLKLFDLDSLEDLPQADIFTFK